MVTAFFQREAAAISQLENQISHAQGELQEALEAAQEAVSFEPEEDEKVTVASVKAYIRSLLNDLKGADSERVALERKGYQDQFDAISAIEERIRQHRETLRQQQAELETKLELKRVGKEDAAADLEAMLALANQRLAALDGQLDTLLEEVTDLMEGYGSFSEPFGTWTLP